MRPAFLAQTCGGARRGSRRPLQRYSRQWSSVNLPSSDAGGADGGHRDRGADPYLSTSLAVGRYGQNRLGDSVRNPISAR
jgi:hypothetical protein